MSNNIFIGVYNGNIAPKGFTQTRKEVFEINKNNAIKAISKIDLKDTQKLGLILGAILLFLAIVKGRKYSLPILVALLAMIPYLMENNSNKPYYYNQFSSGDAIIEIPNIN